VERWNEEAQAWEDVDDCSFCTLTDARSTPEHLEDVAYQILQGVEDAMRSGMSVKHRCQILSWLS